MDNSANMNQLALLRSPFAQMHSGINNASNNNNGLPPSSSKRNMEQLRNTEKIQMLQKRFKKTREQFQRQREYVRETPTYSTVPRENELPGLNQQKLPVNQSILKNSSSHLYEEVPLTRAASMPEQTLQLQRFRSKPALSPPVLPVPNQVQQPKVRIVESQEQAKPPQPSATRSKQQPTPKRSKSMTFAMLKAAALAAATNTPNFSRKPKVDKKKARNPEQQLQTTIPSTNNAVAPTALTQQHALQIQNQKRRKFHQFLESLQRSRSNLAVN